jgi:transcriptional regulator with XRE-family HTH domain
MPFTEAELFDLADAVRSGKDGSAKTLRKDLGLAANAIGEACDVAGTTITRWENGARRPTGRSAVVWIRLMRRLAEGTSASPTETVAGPRVER